MLKFISRVNNSANIAEVNNSTLPFFFLSRHLSAVVLNVNFDITNNFIVLNMIRIITPGGNFRNEILSRTCYL